MSKEQKRLAAIILCIMGIVGSLVAMKDRSAQTEFTTMQTERVTVQITQERLPESPSVP